MLALALRPCFALFGACALALCSACAGGPPRPALQPGYARLQRSSDVAIVYRLRSAERAPLPVVVPGGSWLERDIEELLPDQTFVFYDPRARGRSSGPRELEEFTLAADLEDLEALRKELGLERMTLLGWGYNGGLALRYALLHPERVDRLILIAALPPRRSPYWEEFGRNLEGRVTPAALARLNDLRDGGLAERDPRAFCRELTRTFVRAYCHDPESPNRMRSDPCLPPNLDPDRRAAVPQVILGALGSWDWRAELGALQIPVLLVHGRNDPLPLSSSVEYAELLPQAELVAIPAAGHLPWLDAPEDFAAAVALFLGRKRGP